MTTVFYAFIVFLFIFYFKTQNSANCQLNLEDYCSIIDNQHILLVHKQQSNSINFN
jgi:hypothetical protein